MRFIFLIILHAYSIMCFTQSDTTKMFIFGHSLIDHRPPAISTPSDETTVPHWMYLMSQFEERDYTAGGQYGFLPQHANVPPISQWGYDIVPGVWESDTEPFSEADISHVLITAGNFMQWQGPNEEYPSDPGITPINATQTIVNWVEQQENSIRYYIYENWPDMAPYLNNDFPPSDVEFSRYNAYTRGAFHDWWIEYHDSLLISHPEQKIRMIPVGVVISDILETVIPNLIATSDLYEDNAPHGQASIYFLSALISHMAIHQEKLDSSFDPGTTVHPIIKDSLKSIIDFTWSSLLDFNDSNGDSRVFYNDLTKNVDLEINQNCISIYPNPTSNYLYLDGNLSDYNIQIIDIDGSLQQTTTLQTNTIRVDVNNLPNGQYFIYIEDLLKNTNCLQKIIKN